MVHESSRNLALVHADDTNRVDTPRATQPDKDGTHHTMHRLALNYTNGRIERREVARDTAMRQLSILRNFAAFYGNRDPKLLSKSDIERWMAKRGHLAAGTRRLDIVALRQFIRWLQINRHIRHDPMVTIKSPRIPRRVPRALNVAQTEAIWAVLPDARARLIVALMLWAGLRRAEVIALQLGDWDPASSTLFVTGKGEHERTVPVTGRVATALNDYLDETKIHAGPLIRKHDGRPGLNLGYVSRLMRRWMEDAGVKARSYDGKGCHSLRHTLASNVADIEPDLRVVQELLGHVNLSSTQIYLRRVTITKVRAAMERAA